MDKTTAQQTLKQLQESIEAATEQAKELQAIIDKPEEVYSGVLLSQEEANRKANHRDLWGIYGDGSPQSNCIPTTARTNSGLSFETKEIARRYCEYLQLRQKARIAMAASWGGQEVPWSDRGVTKYVLCYILGTTAAIETYRETYFPIAFCTKTDAVNFKDSLTEDQLRILLTTM